MKAMLLENGAKQTEMDWMRWDDQFAESTNFITKADIQDWIDQNKIEVQEVERGKDIKKPSEEIDDFFEILYNDGYYDMSNLENAEKYLDVNGLRKYYTPEEILLDVIDERYNQTSTILSSQIPLSAWYELIGEQTIADAILDRVVNSSHRIILKGESLRKWGS
ncbi:MAG TPA: ATP-binding protein [Bacteroidaceae bacterium]|nr:ATP-binding protein [Bacteroidaceae bacterium]